MILEGYYFSNCIFIRESNVSKIFKLHIFNSHVAKIVIAIDLSNLTFAQNRFKHYAISK